MPTRLRIVLEAGITRYFGKKAETALIQASKQNILQLPENWKAMSRRERLTLLAKKLPQGYKLTLFQEPKATRRNHSAYWQRRQGQ